MISIIIVNFNTCNLTVECLQSIYNAQHSSDYEIILVDNASVDHSVEEIKRSFPDVILIENTTNVGFARANNQAMRLAKGDIFILLNSDTVVFPNTFTEIIKGFNNNPTAGMLAPQLLNADGSIQPSWGQFASPYTEFFFQTFLYKILPPPFTLGKKIHRFQQKDYQTPHTIPWASGACLAVRREVVQKVGMLDENIFMYGEDMEWCWQVWKNGGAVFFWPDAKVIHYVGASSKKEYSSWIDRYTRGNFFFMKMHSSEFEVKVAAFWVLLGSFARVILWTLIGELFPKRKEESQKRIVGYRKAGKTGWSYLVGMSD